MTIRRLAPADWALLREIRLRSLKEAPEAFGSTHDRELGFDRAEWQRRAGDNGWFVAEGDGEEVVGIVAGFRDPELPEDQRQLVAMWVDPLARGTGVADLLIEAVVGWARAAGATALTLGVAEDNDRARAVYLRAGFVPTAERFPLHSDPSRDIEILARPL